MGGRVTTKLNSNTATDLYFSSAWQVLEEDQGGVVQEQNLWAPDYVDDLVARAPLYTQGFYVQQDANWNVTSLADLTGTVQEYYSYDPYGKVSFYDRYLDPLSGSQYGMVYLFQGGRYDSTSGLYNFQNRDYSSTLGRWMQQDSAGYTTYSPNLYSSFSDNPADTSDPMGLADIKPMCTSTVSTGWWPERWGSPAFAGDGTYSVGENVGEYSQSIANNGKNADYCNNAFGGSSARAGKTTTILVGCPGTYKVTVEVYVELHFYGAFNVSRGGAYATVTGAGGKEIVPDGVAVVISANRTYGNPFRVTLTVTIPSNATSSVVAAYTPTLTVPRNVSAFVTARYSFRCTAIVPEGH